MLFHGASFTRKLSAIIIVNTSDHHINRDLEVIGIFKETNLRKRQQIQPEFNTNSLKMSENKNCKQKQNAAKKKQLKQGYLIFKIINCRRCCALNSQSF